MQNLIFYTIHQFVLVIIFKIYKNYLNNILKTQEESCQIDSKAVLFCIFDRISFVDLF